MMGTNGINRVWRSFKKGIFSKNALFKSYGVIYMYILRRQQLYCVFTLRVASVHAVISSQRLIVSSALLETSQCKRQQATFSFKPVFLHFSYIPALHVLRDHA